MARAMHTLGGEATEAFEGARAKVAAFIGAAAAEDPLYVSVSAGRKHQGMEHWLPFFHAGLETLFDYLPDAAVMLDDQVTPARLARWEAIDDSYDSRHEAMGAKGRIDTVYKPVPPGELYLDDAGWEAAVANHRVIQLSPLPQSPGETLWTDDFSNIWSVFNWSSINLDDWLNSFKQSP